MLRLAEVVNKVAGVLEPCGAVIRTTKSCVVAGNKGTSQDLTSLLLKAAGPKTKAADGSGVDAGPRLSVDGEPIEEEEPEEEDE